MKNFLANHITVITIAIVTIVLVFGGIFLFSGNKNTNTSTNQIPYDQIVPDGSNITGGLVNGIYAKGQPNTKITLVEFGDFECPACAAYLPLTNKLLEEYSGQINFVFRHFPLSQHKNAQITSFAAEAAAKQGKFWEMYDLLYERQKEWSKEANARENVIEYAKELMLDLDKFTKDLESADVKDKVAKDLAYGKSIGVNSTPTFYLNGVKIKNPQSFDGFKEVLSQAFSNNSAETDTSKAYHTHYDIKTYINGTTVDFSQPKYQATKENELNPDTHFHDGEGSVVHIHAKGASIKELFDSFKLTFPSDTDTHKLKIFVNGQQNSIGLNYEPQDLDRVVVSYGPTNDSNIQRQLESVTDVACIYSEKCPERGKAPSEECVGGLGTGCEE